MLRRVYNWTLKQAARKNAKWVLAGISFVESSIFPIPPDILLVPMVLAERKSAFNLAFICTMFSVAGGVLGYIIGSYLFDYVGYPILDFYGVQDSFEGFQLLYSDWGIWIVIFAGLTPFPYKVVTIASGFMGLHPATFILGSVLSRGIRFYLETWLLYHYGDPIKIFVEKYLGWIAALIFLLLLGGFIVVSYV